jgi:L-malate glycosyltransferase
MRKNKKITYLIWNTKPSGGIKIIFEHIHRLNLRGHPVQAITIFGRYPDWYQEKIPFNKLTFGSFFETHDILVTTFWPTVYIALLLRATKRYSFIQGWEEDFYTNAFIKMAANFSLRFNKKIVVSDYLEQKINTYLHKKEMLYKIKETGIDKSIFFPKNNKIKKITKDIYIISIISWYKWYKGADLLEKIVIKLKQNHNKYKFILISNENKTYSPVFDIFISNPTKQTIAKYYNKAHVTLITSRTEGFFIPGLEAMACGSILLTSDNGGINDYAINNYNAVIYKKLSDIWQNNMINNIIHNNKKAVFLRQNGFRTVNQYQWDNIINSLEKIYQ